MSEDNRRVDSLLRYAVLSIPKLGGVVNVECLHAQKEEAEEARDRLSTNDATRRFSVRLVQVVYIEQEAQTP
jgi:hypothetical protein